MTDEPIPQPQTAFEYRTKAPRLAKGDELYFFSNPFCERPSSGIFISPYNMVRAVGLQTPPKIARASHATSYLLGPQITILLNKIGTDTKDLDITLQEVDPAKLSAEIIKTIQHIQDVGISAISLPAQILQNPLQLPEIQKINQFTAKALEQYEGLVLSGGPDVEVEFYTFLDQIPSQRDYRRSMAEFALIKKAVELKKPILGICRGGQILNVYFGGTLQNVAEQKKWQSVHLADSSRKKELESLFNNQPIFAYASHHQACNRIANGFEVVLYSKEKTPEMIWSKDGFCIGTQFHPEYPCDDLYSNVIEICRFFFQKIKETKRSKCD